MVDESYDQWAERQINRREAEEVKETIIGNNFWHQAKVVCRPCLQQCTSPVHSDSEMDQG